MTLRSLLTFALVPGALWLLSGCGGKTEYQEYGKSEKAAPEEHHEHEHGPHGGHIVELGEHEYHAEVVVEGQKVTVYFLDAKLEKPQPVAAQEVVLNVEADGQTIPVTLAAAPQEGDPEGQSSRFEVAENETIKEHVHDIEELHGTMAVTIDGKPYTGELSHEHGHEHEHETEKSK